MKWSTACLDWEKRIVAGESLIPLEPLFPEEAEAGLSVFKELRIVDAPGSPMISESCAQWVFDFAAAVFGAYDSESGRRLIQEFFLLIPKKNSKSTIAAGVMLTALIRNWRESAEFIILAPTKEIADNSFIPVRDMIRKNDVLTDLLHIQEHTRTITHLNNNATLKVVAADGDTVGGKKAVGILVDEAWLFGKKSKAEDIIREATGGLASRPEGFVIFLTTQSNEPPAGIFKKKLMYARGVRDGRIDDNRFLPVLYEFPKHMIDAGEHKKPENLKLVNPNLNYSVDSAFLERGYKQALEDGADSLIGFLAKHGNVEVGLALLSNNWSGAEFWEQQSDVELSLEDIIAECEVIDIGIDGGGLDDLLGLYVIGRSRQTREWLGWGHAWAHESVLTRRKEIASNLMDFSEAGELTIVKRVGDDTEGVAEIAYRIYSAGLLDKIGMDPAGIGGVLDALIERGIPQELIVGVSQGWRLGGAIKTLERKLAEETFWHAHQSLMNWCCGNAKVEPRGNAILITKQASGNAKIDPLMAAFNAVSLLSENPVASESVHDFMAAIRDPIL
ncbi:terminase [Thiopseudomonas alkaliphila]|uniref:Terminase n=1 Tax=Thiopseudomonas alkaliphila TaxID=1697053 RepID=A0A0K1XGK4_9GAMM|nr:terminase large subunit [Thiopseudomonas alkaliphila]AKX43982.1 terminase [Thiopseudomonas alkaliphila]AKX52027.1 terminase [Thiopseudomonas alkaliphila]AKX60466.1 terminase [Thiopseudomonas alkaliphila]